jgi:signal transduction histidine kinase
VLVEDDGPGLEISTEAAFMRGGRLDELGRGNHGLGLSIAKEIVEAAGGTLDLQRSVLGGLRVALSWSDPQ